MIRVAVGVLQRDDGKTLLMQRLPGTFREGQWEFPGGKIEAGEDSLQALVRELREELGIKVCNARPRITLCHAYPEKTVLLEVWQVTQFTGQPHNPEGHKLRWVTLAELGRSRMLDADGPIIKSLELPDTYVITPSLAPDDASEPVQWLKQLERTLDQGVSLLQLRCPGWSLARFARLAKTVVRHCDASGTKLLLNGDPGQVLSLSEKLGAAGCHFPVRFLDRLTGLRRPGGLLIGASCHSEAELAAAARADVDFCVLGPVLPTVSHPQRSALSWTGFEDAVRKATVPVFALGGLAVGDLETAWQHGAQGVAGISGFWTR